MMNPMNMFGYNTSLGYFSTNQPYLNDAQNFTNFNFESNVQPVQNNLVKTPNRPSFMTERSPMKTNALPARTRSMKLASIPSVISIDSQSLSADKTYDPHLELSKPKQIKICYEDDEEDEKYPQIQNPPR